MRDSILLRRSYQFAVDIIKASGRMRNANKEFILSRQLARSGTSIGALIREAQYAESKADFKHKLIIALKEANETAYWIDLIRDTKGLPDEVVIPLKKDCNEILAMLIAATKTLKQNTSN